MAAADVSPAPSTSTARRHHPFGAPVHPLSTPGRLRLASIVVALAVVALGVVGVRAATDRQQAADTVGLEATPLLIGAEDLYVALADADAAASTAFLRAGLEPPELRARYLDDIGTAGERLADIAGQHDLSAEARTAIATITKQLPVYSGLVESAHADSRQGFPIGAAYLRRASDLIRASMLPAATNVYQDAAQHLYRGYRSGTSRAAGVAVLAAVGVAMVLLLGSQLLVARRTRRIVNLGLVGATMLVVALGAWALVAFDNQQDALIRSQREGSDQLVVLSVARILALRSLSDENLDLIERGTEPTYQQDFADVTARIGKADGTTGLLATAAQHADRTGTGAGIDGIAGRYGDYLAQHQRVRQLDDAFEYRDAVGVAVTDQAAASTALDKAFTAEIKTAGLRLAEHAQNARRSLRALTVAIAALALLAAALAVVGLQQRIREYR